jgi:uncharacterized protein (DUF1684 family)
MKRHLKSPKISDKTEKKHLQDLNKFMLNSKFLQLFDRGVKIDHKHDVPYLAGYSKDGGTIYLDRHLPLEIKIDGKRVNITGFIVRHEHTEKSLIDAFGMKYLPAHRIATAAEHELVQFHGIDPMEYEAKIRPHIKTAENEKLIKIPTDLDLTPYVDEHDILAKKIQKRIKAEKIGK